MQVAIRHNQKTQVAEFFVYALGTDPTTLVLEPVTGRLQRIEIDLTAGQIDVLRELLDTVARRRATDAKAAL